MEDTQQVPESAPATKPTRSGSSYAVPAAILIGFAMIAGAIFMSSGNKGPATVSQTGSDNTAEQPELKPVPEINESDHVLGSPNAPIVIVEYSDFDCPFCKQFHETMHSVIDKYGADGKVAWVYRQFPLSQLHPSAPHLAEASECVAELGGNEAFWKFADLVFGERATNELTDTTKLPDYAATAGVDKDAYNECVESGRNRAKVDEDFNDGVAAGVRGTPYSFIQIAGQQLPVNGAQPLEYITANLDSLIEQLEKADTTTE